MWKMLSLLPKKIKLMGIVAIILSIIQPFLSMTIPTISKQLVSFLASNNSDAIEVYFINPEWRIGVYNPNQALGVIIGLTFGVAVLLVLVAYFSGLLTVYTKIYGIYHIRKILFNHLLTLSRKNIDKITVSTLITRFSNDINKIGDGFFILCRGMFISPFFVIWGLAFALITNLWLSISVAVIIPFIVLAAVFAIYKLFPLYRKENRMLDLVNQVSKEDINAISLIKSYNLENRQFERFKITSANLTNTSKKAAKNDSIAWPLIDLIVLIGNIILFCIVAILINQFNDNTKIRLLVADIYQFTSYMSMISMGIYTTLFTLNKLFRSNISAKRINEILNIKTDIPVVKSKNKITNGGISIKNLSFGYNEEQEILKNISFEIPKGQSIGIIGKTGCGKSTLIRLITKEYKIENANSKILIDNIDINDINTDDLYSKMTTVFQKPIILSGTVKSNITFGLSKYSNQDIDEAIKLSCSNFIYNYADKLDHIISQRGSNLSGGQKQRLAIAQAIIKKPKILIFDDALSALDNKTDRTIRENLKKYCKDMTVIIVSQRINSIKECDKIVVLDNGSISGEGSHEYLVQNNDIYRSIYEAQENGGE
ncbi:ABC transporter ATP-binding protein [Mycoplasmopsis felifaucium]|uniref:ABC transporter ATP-binding protein n=1 Tax=Mycoplasmopsis felifaucium TaxID=35768 RepID=A0ABZ2RR11_9BACT